MGLITELVGAVVSEAFEYFGTIILLLDCIIQP